MLRQVLQAFALLAPLDHKAPSRPAPLPIAYCQPQPHTTLAVPFRPQRSVGAGANFTGSGGAVVVYCPGGEAQADALRAAAQAEGYTLLAAELGPDREQLPPAPPAP